MRVRQVSDSAGNRLAAIGLTTDRIVRRVQIAGIPNAALATTLG